MISTRSFFLFLVFSLLINCSDKKEKTQENVNTLYRIAGDDYPNIYDFEFNLINKHKKDSLYLNICYLKYDSIKNRENALKLGIDRSLRYLFIKEFDLNEKIPTNINYYLSLSDQHTFFFDSTYQGIPFALKFKDKGKKILVLAPYEKKLKQINNSNNVYKIEKYSIYIDTISVF